MKQTLLLAFALLLALLVSLGAFSKSPKRTRVEMLTSRGLIILELYNETPIHRDNFIKLCREGFYNNILFHRVIENFMIQAGDPDSRNAKQHERLGDGEIGYTLESEFRFPKYYHKRGALAAAREGDEVNPEKRSSGSHFYIVWGNEFDRKDIDKYLSRIEKSAGIKYPKNIRRHYINNGGTPHLDGTYTVFGEVKKGFEVIYNIQSVDTDKNDRPIDDIRILSVTVKE